MALEVKEETVGEVRVLGLEGRLDTDTSADLELAVQDLIDAGANHFIVDLAGVGYVSSAGLRVLLMLAKKIDGSGSLRLCGLNPTVRQVFDVAGFTQLFRISTNREAILGEAAAPARPAASAKPKEPAKSLEPAKAAVQAKPEPVAVVARSGSTLAATASKLLGIRAGKAATSKVDAKTVSEVLRVLGISASR